MRERKTSRNKAEQTLNVLVKKMKISHLQPVSSCRSSCLTTLIPLPMICDACAEGLMQEAGVVSGQVAGESRHLWRQKL